MEENKQVCPWCQTEITWDPELGPEEECPHCYNELGDYRSVSLSPDRMGEDSGADGNPDDSESFNDEESSSNPYGQQVERCIDGQEEAPECSNCREMMLLAGQSAISSDGFEAAVPAALGRPVLQAPIRLDVYVCPSCFKVETYLASQERLALIGNVTWKSSTT